MRQILLVFTIFLPVITCISALAINSFNGNIAGSNSLNNNANFIDGSDSAILTRSSSSTSTTTTTSTTSTTSTRTPRIKDRFRPHHERRLPYFVPYGLSHYFGSIGYLPYFPDGRYSSFYPFYPVDNDRSRISNQESFNPDGYLAYIREMYGGRPSRRRQRLQRYDWGSYISL